MILLQNEYIEGLASKGERIDDRKPEDFREIKLETGVIENAGGSARVRLGKTDVIVGVKLGIGEPFPDSQDKGILMVNSEFSAIAHRDFEKGRPGEDSVELSRVIDRGIRESKAIDMEKLCIEKGEKVWMVFIDVEIVNHDGNLIDAAGLAATAALQGAKMPEYDKKTDTLDYDKRTKPLPVKFKPLPVTVVKIGETLMLDPTLEEEEVADAKLTVSTKDNGNICAFQKGGTGSLTFEDIEKIIDMASKKTQELRKLVK